MMLQTNVKARMLVPQRKALAESARQDWVVTVEDGTSIDEVLDPAFWSLVCNDFQPMDRVDVRVDTGEWMAELVVLVVERTWCKVHMLHFYELGTPGEAPAVAARFRIEWKGAVRRFAVIRVSDGEPVQEKFQSRADAVAWLGQYERTTSPAAAVQ